MLHDNCNGKARYTAAVRQVVLKTISAFLCMETHGLQRSEPFRPWPSKRFEGGSTVPQDRCPLIGLIALRTITIFGLAVLGQTSNIEHQLVKADKYPNLSYNIELLILNTSYTTFDMTRDGGQEF